MHLMCLECQTDDTSSPAIDDDDPNSQEYTGSSLPSLLTEMPDLKTTDALGRWEMHTKVNFGHIVIHLYHCLLFPSCTDIEVMT